jgi:hypothetical protein
MKYLISYLDTKTGLYGPWYKIDENEYLKYHGSPEYEQYMFLLDVEEESESD